MSKVTIYHNPRCSKSRRALEILRERGIEPEIVEYLKTPPDAATLDRLLKAMNLEPLDIVRKNEDAYRQLGLEATGWTREELIRQIVAHPILIERPIVVKGQKAVLARPPERALEILSS